MRLRKLGHGQSVMFFAPLEVDRKIREARGPQLHNNPVKVIDVLRWTMGETCAEILRNVPHWANQGLDYMHRKAAETEYDSIPGDDIEARREVLRRAWLQTEAKPLEELYNRPQSQVSHPAYGIAELKDRFDLLGVHSVVDACIEEVSSHFH